MAMDEAGGVGGGGGGGGGESVGVVVRLRPEEQSTDAGGADLAGSCVLCVEDQKITIVDPGGRTSSSGGGGGGGGGSSVGSGGSGGGGGVSGGGGKGDGRREQQQQQGKQAHDFSFDRVFGPGASQDQVFDTVKPLVHATVDGFTTTVFAYGSTGSGKTHTISGTEKDPGVLPRAVNLLFERLQADAAAGSDKAFMVFLTYVEIYNNVFHNLLETAGGSGGSGSGAGKRSKSPRPDGTTTPPRSPASKIEVREHPSRGVFLSGGRGLRVPVNSAAAVVTLVSHGTKARRTASTGLNDRSSRSHAILILEIEATHSRTALAVRSTSPCRSATSAPAGPGGPAGGASGGGGGSPKGYRRGRRASIVECVSIGKMQVIDLAGSERVSMSGVEGSSLVEAQNINLSLTLLGDVLSALSKYHRAAARSTGGAAGAAAEKPFVPYRNSKLTYLLKDSLGGNCKTLMICAVRAAPACFQQTMMSLRYAGRARDIKNVPHRVLEAVDAAGGREGGPGGASLRGTVDEIERLRTQLLQTTTEFERLRGATASGESEKDQLRQQLQGLAEKNRCEKDRMDELLEGVIHSQKGELEMRKAEFVDLQDTMDSHADTIEKQKERIRDLQTEREAASSEASTAKEQVQGLRQALQRAEKASEQLHQEASSLRAKKELLRIERDGVTSKVSRMQEEQRKTEAARKTEGEAMESYRKAVKKMAKEREGLKTAAREAGERADQATAALAESKRGMEAAAAVAILSEEALLSREAKAEERARAAEGKARQLENQSHELSQRLSRKAEEGEQAAKDKEEMERHCEKMRAEAQRCRGELDRAARKSAAEATAAASSLSRASQDLDAEKDRATRAKAAAKTLREELAVVKAELSALKESAGLLRRQKAEIERGRELQETRNRDVETALAVEASKRSIAEESVQRLEGSTASALRELEVLRESLADASSGRAAAADRARRLSTENRVLAEKLELATAATSSVEASAILLKEELAVARRKTGSVEEKLRESTTGIEVLRRRCAEKDTETEELRDSLAERDAGMTRLGAEVQAATRRGEEALRAMSDLHREEVEGACRRLEAKSAEMEGVRQQMEEKDVKIANMSERMGARAREAAAAEAARREEEADARDRERGELRAALELRTAEVAAARELVGGKTEEARRLGEASDLSKREAEEARKSLGKHNAEIEHLRGQLEAQRAETVAAREVATRDAAEADRRLRDALDEARAGGEATVQEILRQERERVAEEVGKTGRELRAKEDSLALVREAMELQTKKAEEENRRLLASQKEAAESRLREVSTLSRNEAEESREALKIHTAEIARLREQLEAQRAETEAAREKATHDAVEAGQRIQEELTQALAEGEAVAEKTLRQQRQRLVEEATEANRVLRAKCDSLELARESTELQAKQAEEDNRRMLASQQEAAEERLRKELELHEKEAEEARERLDLKYREAARLAEERIAASFREREVETEEERQRAARENRELLQGKAEDKERELIDILGVKEGEVVTLMGQLKGLAREVRRLESSKAKEGEAREREVQQSRAALLASEERATAAEKRALTFATARDEATTAAAAAVADVEAASRASGEEEGNARVALKQELDSSRTETSALQSRLEEAGARLVEARGEAETARGELSALRDEWKQKEVELGQHLRAVREEGAEAIIKHKSALANTEDELHSSLESEKKEAATREASLRGRVAGLEALVNSLRHDLEDAVEERDAAESSGQKRSDGMRQRELTLGKELRAERACAATLRAASEKAKLDAEEFQMEIALLRAGSAALEEDRNVLQEELPQLQARLEEKDSECQELSTGKKEAGILAQEEAARARGLEREVERLRGALRCTIATVQQHITSADPNSPAALLAADLAFHSVARGGGDASSSLSETASGGQPRARGSSSTVSGGGSADGVEESRLSPLPATHMLRVGAGESTASVGVAEVAGGRCGAIGDATAMVVTEETATRERARGNGYGAPRDALVKAAGSEEAVGCSSDARPGIAIGLNVTTVGARGASPRMPPAPPAENEGVRAGRSVLMQSMEAGLGRNVGWALTPNIHRGGGGGDVSSGSSGSSSGGGSGDGGGGSSSRNNIRSVVER